MDACSVCLDQPPRHAVETSCGHIYCGMCIQDALNHNERTGVQGPLLCPNCRQEVESFDFHYLAYADLARDERTFQQVHVMISAYNREHAPDPPLEALAPVPQFRFDPLRIEPSAPVMEEAYSDNENDPDFVLLNTRRRRNRGRLNQPRQVENRHQPGESSTNQWISVLVSLLVIGGLFFPALIGGIMVIGTATTLLLAMFVTFRFVTYWLAMLLRAGLRVVSVVMMVWSCKNLLLSLFGLKTTGVILPLICAAVTQLLARFMTPFVARLERTAENSYKTVLAVARRCLRVATFAGV